MVVVAVDVPVLFHLGRRLSCRGLGALMLVLVSRVVGDCCRMSFRLDISALLLCRCGGRYS